MEKDENGRRKHVLVFPIPAQGHLNPMLQFSKRLASMGIRVTFVTSVSSAKYSMKTDVGSVTIETYSDFWDERQGRLSLDSFDNYYASFKLISSKCITSLVEKYKGSDSPIKCIIYNSMAPWALDISKSHGLLGASFYTQSLAVCAIYHYVHTGMLRTPVKDPEVSLPRLPVLKTQDLPSFVSDSTETNPVLLKFVANQFVNVDQIDFLLFNSFDRLEEEVVNWMKEHWPRTAFTIGPTLPSTYLDKRVEGDEDYGLNLFKPDSSSYMKWLDMKEAGSVVYAAFGSVGSMGDEAMEEIAWGLRMSGKPFLWVVRESEQQKLPSSFRQEIAEKGLVVAWCPQLKVLAHRAIGCFITHCGWNSTLEALSFGVPTIAMPQWTDQTTNAKLIEDVWKVGIRVNVNKVGREEIKHCIEEVLEGEKGKEMKRNADKFREFAKEAVSEGGSSDKNIGNFLASLFCD